MGLNNIQARYANAVILKNEENSFQIGLNDKRWFDTLSA